MGGQIANSPKASQHGGERSHSGSGKANQGGTTPCEHKATGNRHSASHRCSEDLSLRGRPVPSRCRDGRCMRRCPGNESANTQPARHDLDRRVIQPAVCDAPRCASFCLVDTGWHLVHMAKSHPESRAEPAFRGTLAGLD